MLVETTNDVSGSHVTFTARKYNIVSSCFQAVGVVFSMTRKSVAHGLCAAESSVAPDKQYQNTMLFDCKTRAMDRCFISCMVTD
jgi:hypothetical protein